MLVRTSHNQLRMTHAIFVVTIEDRTTPSGGSANRSADQHPKEPDARQHRDQPADTRLNVVGMRKQTAMRHHVGNRHQQNDLFTFFKDVHGVSASVPSHCADLREGRAARFGDAPPFWEQASDRLRRALGHPQKTEEQECRGCRTGDGPH